MTDQTYKSRLVGGMAVIAMHKDTLGQEFKRSVTDGVICFTPITDEDKTV